MSAPLHREHSVFHDFFLFFFDPKKKPLHNSTILFLFFFFKKIKWPWYESQGNARVISELSSMALRHYADIWLSPHKHACAHPENEISLFCCDLNPLVVVFSPQCLIGGNCDQLSFARSLLSMMNGQGRKHTIFSIFLYGWGWVGGIKSKKEKPDCFVRIW